jgi:hypothetical protein
MAAVVAAVITAAATPGLTGILTRFALSTAASFILSKAFQPDIPTNSPAAQAADPGVKQRIPTQTSNKIPVFYGEGRLFGSIWHAAISSDNQKMAFIVLLCEGPISSINNIWWDQYQLTLDGSGDVTNATDRSGNTDDFLNGNLKILKFPSGGPCTPMENFDPNKWGDGNVRNMPNLAYLYVELNYNRDEGITGLTNKLSAEIQGKLVKTFTAPTTTTPTTVSSALSYSNNPAECFYDYLTSTIYGAGNIISSDKVDLETFHTSKEFCNTQKDYYTDNVQSGTAKRYTCNGLVNTNNNRDIIITDFTSCSQSTFGYSLGKFQLIPNTTGTSVMSFNSELGNIYGSLVTVNEGLNESYNLIETSFMSKANLYQDDQVYVNLTNRAFNEVELVKNIRARFTNNNVEAERLSTVLLNNSRNNLTVTFKTDLRALKVQINDIISVSNEVYQNKLFRIVALNETDINGGIAGYEIVAREYDENDYVDLEINLNSDANNSDLPNPRIFSSITDLSSQAINANGSVPFIDLSWTIPSGIVERFELVSSSSEFGVYKPVDNIFTTTGTFTNGENFIRKVINVDYADNLYFKVRPANQFVKGQFSNVVHIEDFNSSDSFISAGVSGILSTSTDSINPDLVNDRYVQLKYADSNQGLNIRNDYHASIFNQTHTLGINPVINSINRSYNSLDGSITFPNAYDNKDNANEIQKIDISGTRSNIGSPNNIEINLTHDVTKLNSLQTVNNIKTFGPYGFLNLDTVNNDLKFNNIIGLKGLIPSGVSTSSNFGQFCYMNNDLIAITDSQNLHLFSINSKHKIDYISSVVYSTIISTLTFNPVHLHINNLNEVLVVRTATSISGGYDEAIDKFDSDLSYLGGNYYVSPGNANNIYKSVGNFIVYSYYLQINPTNSAEKIYALDTTQVWNNGSSSGNDILARTTLYTQNDPNNKSIYDFELIEQSNSSLVKAFILTSVPNSVFGELVDEQLLVQALAPIDVNSTYPSMSNWTLTTGSKITASSYYDKKDSIHVVNSSTLLIRGFNNTQIGKINVSGINLQNSDISLYEGSYNLGNNEIYKGYGEYFSIGNNIHYYKNSYNSSNTVINFSGDLTSNLTIENSLFTSNISVTNNNALQILSKLREDLIQLTNFDYNVSTPIYTDSINGGLSGWKIFIEFNNASSSEVISFLDTSNNSLFVNELYQNINVGNPGSSITISFPDSINGNTISINEIYLTSSNLNNNIDTIGNDLVSKLNQSSSDYIATFDNTLNEISIEFTNYVNSNSSLWITTIDNGSATQPSDISFTNYIDTEFVIRDTINISTTNLYGTVINGTQIIRELMDGSIPGTNGVVELPLGDINVQVNWLNQRMVSFNNKINFSIDSFDPNRLNMNASEIQTNIGLNIEFNNPQILATIVEGTLGIDQTIIDNAPKSEFTISNPNELIADYSISVVGINPPIPGLENPDFQSVLDLMNNFYSDFDFSYNQAYYPAVSSELAFFRIQSNIPYYLNDDSFIITANDQSISGFSNMTAGNISLSNNYIASSYNGGGQIPSHYGIRAVNIINKNNFSSNPSDYFWFTLVSTHTDDSTSDVIVPSYNVKSLHTPFFKFNDQSTRSDEFKIIPANSDGNYVIDSEILTTQSLYGIVIFNNDVAPLSGAEMIFFVDKFFFGKRIKDNLELPTSGQGSIIYIDGNYTEDASQFPGGFSNTIYRDIDNNSFDINSIYELVRQDPTDSNNVTLRYRKYTN